MNLKLAAIEAARFSNFAQRVKMRYWEDKEETEGLLPESEIDQLLLLAWEDFKT